MKLNAEAEIIEAIGLNNPQLQPEPEVKVEVEQSPPPTIYNFAQLLAEHEPTQSPRQ